MKGKDWSALQALEIAMEREKGGKEFYLSASEKTIDHRGKAMYQWLAKQEERHFDILSKQKEALRQGSSWAKMLGGEAPLNPSEFPALSEATGGLRPAAGELEALKQGMEAERASISLYTDAAAKTSDANGKAMFLRLVEEEKGHLELLEEEWEWLSKSRAYFTLHRFQLPGSR